MRKVILILGLCLFASKAHAAPPVAEAPVRNYGTPATVSISSTTLTKVPTSQTSGRVGIFLDNPNTNAQPVVGFYGNCTSTSLASTIRPFEINPSANTSFIPMREDVCLWLLSLDTATSSESVHYQEAIQ